MQGRVLGTRTVGIYSGEEVSTREAELSTSNKGGLTKKLMSEKRSLVNSAAGENTSHSKGRVSVWGGR